MSQVPRELAETDQGSLDAQRRALAVMESATQPGTPQGCAEGYRRLTRIASLCQDWILEKETPQHPTLFVSQGPARKLIVDNPDVTYWFACLDPSRHTRLRGTRGAAPYVGLRVGTDIFRGAGCEPTGTRGQTNLDRFEIAADGSFELNLGPEGADLPPGRIGNSKPL